MNTCSQSLYSGPSTFTKVPFNESIPGIDAELERLYQIVQEQQQDILLLKERCGQYKADLSDVRHCLSVLEHMMQRLQPLDRRAKSDQPELPEE